MKVKFFTIIIYFVVVSLYSQQDSQYTDYMYNTITINPAYAGSRGVLSIFGLHRNQWVNMDGAPVTNTVAIHAPIENSKVGIGFSVINDKIGPSEENSISLDLSYTIDMSEKYKLSFGIDASANLLNVNFGKLKIYDSADILATQNIENQFSFNTGGGIYIRSDKTYFGLSIPNFLETKHFDDQENNLSTATVATEKMHYYFIAGHVFDLSSNIKFKPAILTKWVKGAPLQVDLSANFLYNDKFSLGLAYRWDAAVSGLAGFQVSDSWFIGYAYDMEITELSNYNSGSHELFLRFELLKNYNKITPPRFF